MSRSLRRGANDTGGAECWLVVEYARTGAYYDTNKGVVREIEEEDTEEEEADGPFPPKKK